MFTIGRFARLAGVSPKLLRAYDGLALFRPAWVDPTSSYRYYSPAQLPELRRILALRDMGLALAEIRGLVGGGADLRHALDRRRAELERERREIERRLTALDIRMDLATGTADQPDVVVRTIPAEPVATMALADDEDVGAAFYELEAYIRDVKRRAHRPPGALVPLEPRDEDRVEIFVPVSGPVEPTARVGFRRLAACRAATLLQRGSYDQVAAARETLLQWVAAAGLAVDGLLRIIYLQFGAEPELAVPRDYIVARSADYLTELQLPVA